MTVAALRFAFGVFLLAIGAIQSAPAADAPVDAPASSAFGSLGLVLDGLTVSKVEPDSKAARAGLLPGDVVTIVGDAAVKTKAAAEAAVRNAIEAKWSAIPLRAKRNEQVLYFYVY